MEIAIIAIICFYAALNVAITKTMDIKQMKARYITNQCTIGKIAANIFYLPVWISKALKVVIVFMVK